MKVAAIHTRKVVHGNIDILGLLDESLHELKEKSVLLISSKIVAICEGRTAPINKEHLQELIRQEAEWYMPDIKDQHGYTFTISHNLLTPNSGIDESNVDGEYALWPERPQDSANTIREYLSKKYGLKEFGVILVDSSFLPLRWGAVGLALSYSGISPLKNYSHQQDIFGRPLKQTRSNIVDGLATTGVLLMGEGAEQTPMALIEDFDGVEFVSANPSKEELEGRYIPPTEDSFGPILASVRWLPGGANHKDH